MARKVHGGRGMLNLPGHHTVGCIVAEIENTGDWREGTGRNGEPAERYNITPNITLTIADCDHRINLDFDVDTANELENSLHKVDTIIKHLRSFRKGLIVEHHRYVDRAIQIDPQHRHGMSTPTRSAVTR